jgi:hypothetical protein
MSFKVSTDRGDTTVIYERVRAGGFLLQLLLTCGDAKIFVIYDESTTEINNRNARGRLFTWTSFACDGKFLPVCFAVKRTRMTATSEVTYGYLGSASFIYYDGTFEDSTFLLYDKNPWSLPARLQIARLNVVKIYT